MTTVKLTYSELSVKLKEFSNATNDRYNSYAFAAGFFESTLANLLADLPVRKQNEVISSLQNIITK